MAAGTTRRGPAYRLVAGTVANGARVFTRHDWRGLEHLPRDTGFIACPNHLSNYDPFVITHYLYGNGFAPKYLAKASLFDVPVAGRALRAAGQIPVHRDTDAAAGSLEEAAAVLAAGDCLVIYPEATLTRDPELWPMTGKTGAARLALRTGVPLVPIGQWGVQEVAPPGRNRPRLLPRTTVHVWAGPPVDLSEFAGRPADPEALEAATEKILDGITAVVAQIRGEPAPPPRWSRSRRSRAQPPPGRGTPNEAGPERTDPDPGGRR